MDENENSKSKTKRIVSIFIVIASLALVILFIGSVRYANSRNLLNGLTKNQMIVNSIENGLKSLSKNGEKDINIKLDYAMLSLLGMPVASESNNVQLHINYLTKGNDFETKINMTVENITIQSGEIIKKDDLLVLYFPSLFNGYIGINHDDADAAAEKLGFDMENDEDSEYIINGGKFLSKYSQIVYKEVNDFIETQNEQILINNESRDTKVYHLNIKDRELHKLLVAVLSKLKDDEEAIDFIAETMNRISSYVPEEILVKKSKEEYKNNIRYNLKEAYNNLVTTNFEYDDEDLLDIKVYLEKNKTIKTEISFLSNGIEQSIKLETVEGFAKLYLDIDDNKLIFSYNGEKINGEYTGNLNLENDGINLPLAQITISENKKTDRKIKDVKTLDVKIVNDMTDEELEALKEEIQNNME